jgi:hypothetical protein
VTSADPTPARGRCADRLAAIVVCLAACLPYLRTVSDYFVQDDFGVVQLLAAKPWHMFPRWFTLPWMELIWGYTPDEIRPFTALSYQITALAGASRPEGHHLLNIALHTANSLLVFAIARTAARLTLAGATVAGLAFALLPSSAESVAWITGRVDSLPAFYYLLSFLCYARWRSDSTGSSRLYVWSLIWFFQALFSKQNTITMVAAIAAYDWIVLRRPIRISWTWLRPYVPFAVLTAGFLALRYAILGEALRESQLSSQRFAEFEGIFARHVRRMIWGDLREVPTGVMAFAALFAAAAALAILRAQSAVRRSALGAAFYFGVIWVVLGLAPTVAAGYESPRHAYLAAAGWTILIGLAFDALRTLRVDRNASLGSPPLWRRAVTAATVVIVVVYGVGLHREISDWRLRSAVSELSTIELERQVRGAPEGSLFVVGVPVPSWEWAAPFVAHPPYATTDLTKRALIVMPRLLHCCRGRYWDEETREALRAWSASGTPIVALHISSRGEVRRLTDADEPELKTLVGYLLNVGSGDNLDGAIQDILRKLVAGRGHVIRGALTQPE